MAGAAVNLRAFFLASLLTGVCAVSAVAQTNTGPTLDQTQKELTAAEQERARLQQEAVRLDRELQKIRRETIAAARAAQDRETEISRIEARIGELARLEAVKQDTLRENEEGMRRVLGALVRMTRNPPGAMLFQDRSPADTVRGAILLRATVPAIENRVAQVRYDLNELAHTRSEMIKRREDLSGAVAALNQDRTRLDDLMRQKTSLKKKAEEDRESAERKVRALARQAKDLKDLVARITEQKKQEQARATALSPDEIAAVPVSPSDLPRRFSEARGRIPYPVAGRVIGAYGEKLESGLARKGVSLETRFGAQVTAPFGGNIVFAGPFRGYGLLLIIEHGEGYHTLLAGLSRLDVDLGQTVLAGEPIGIMNPAQGSTADAQQRPLLYVELRRNSEPIDPKPWLQAGKENASG